MKLDENIQSVFYVYGICIALSFLVVSYEVRRLILRSLKDLVLCLHDYYLHILISKYW